jgi:benzoyl-CoA reductase/2-hydroxyglutaryl-CoA dehydratase subunit BcrC/BadD/HgdB
MADSRQEDLGLINRLCSMIRTELEMRGLSEAVGDMLTRLDLVIRFERQYHIQADEHILSLHAHATPLSNKDSKQYEFDYEDEMGEHG